MLERGAAVTPWTPLIALILIEVILIALGVLAISHPGLPRINLYAGILAVPMLGLFVAFAVTKARTQGKPMITPRAALSAALYLGLCLTVAAAVVGALAAFHVFWGTASVRVKAAAAGFYVVQAGMVAFAKVLPLPAAIAIGVAAIAMLILVTGDRLREGLAILWRGPR